MLSELLSANLATPFLLKMVEGFFLSSGKEKNSETEAAVGLWTGKLRPQCIQTMSLPDQNFRPSDEEAVLTPRKSGLGVLHYPILHVLALEWDRR